MGGRQANQDNRQADGRSEARGQKPVTPNKTGGKPASKTKRS